MRLEFRRVLLDRKSTRLNSSHTLISYAVFCLKNKKLLLFGAGQIKGYEPGDAGWGGKLEDLRAVRAVRRRADHRSRAPRRPLERHALRLPRPDRAHGVDRAQGPHLPDQ